MMYTYPCLSPHPTLPGCDVDLDIKGTTIDIKASCGAPLLIAKGFETRQQMQLQFPSKAEAASWLQALQFETHRHGLGKDDEETF